MKKPNLILQMQRMGDLILTFPLLAYMHRYEPDRPLWVVAEEIFFKELMQFTPQAVFFTASRTELLYKKDYHHIINLSHTIDASILNGSLNSLKRIGPYILNNVNYTNGFWQLYRQAIVHNNRHNTFHWADLNVFDCMETITDVAKIHLPLPKTRNSKIIGLFVGASQKGKTLAPLFWAELACKLRDKGFNSIFLGGKAEAEAGAEAEKISKMENSNMCGKFSIGQLAQVLKSLDLLICPDTGPMHLAAWLSTQTLNLSLGSVNPWETGPMHANHYILQAKISCSGCWECTQKTMLCHEQFKAKKIASIAQIIVNNQEQLKQIKLKGLNLYKTQKDEWGMHTIANCNENYFSQRQLISMFWRKWFLSYYEPNINFKIDDAKSSLMQHAPHIVQYLQKNLVQLSKELKQNIYKGNKPLNKNFDQQFSPLIRPITSFMYLYLQNSEYSKDARNYVIDAVANISQHLR